MALLKRTLPANYNNLSVSERREVREQYVEVQGGKCWLCQQSLAGPPGQKVQDYPLTLSLFPPGFLDHPIHLHHDHNTGLTIGAVHAKCNGVLWEHYGE